MIEANKLFWYRRKSGLKQRDLASMVDCTEQYISQLETGRSKPTVDMKYRIAKALKIDPEFVWSDR